MTICLEFNSIQPMETTQASLDHLTRENPLGEARKDAQRQAHQDRSHGGLPLPLRDISDGGSGCAADTLSGNP